MPKVSIIIPVYNVEKYLQQCLDSVINQTLRDLEIICVDDGSTDSSLKIVESYAASDSRIKILKQSNGGAGKARNEALKIARGEYIHFLDSDDWLINDNVYAKSVAILEKNPDVSFLMFGYQKYDNMNKTSSSIELPTGLLSEKVLTYTSDYAVLLKLPVVPWNKLYRKSFLQRYNIMFDELICANDRTFYFKSIYFANKIILLKDYFMNYRTNNQESLVGQARTNHFNCHITAYKNSREIISNDNVESSLILTDLTMKDFLYFYNKISYPENKSIYKELNLFFNNWNEINEIDDGNFTWSAQYRIIKNGLDEQSIANIIPIVLATNNGYAPYLEVTLESIKYYANNNCFYDIYILYDSLSEKYINIFKNKTESNIRVQCINVTPMINSNLLYEKGHFSREMYFRFLIPELLPHYKKVIYLDCDLIVTKDIAELYDIDLEGSVMGVINNFTNKDMYNYVKNTLKINPNDYFNSGVLLIDTSLFKLYSIKEKCLQLLSRMTKLACPDQDVLNISCNGRVKYLDSRWNFQWHHQWGSSGGPLAEYFQKQFDNAKDNPFIIHYTSNNKPWKNPEKPLAEKWWFHARNSECYEEILFTNLEYVLRKHIESHNVRNTLKENGVNEQGKAKTKKNFLKRITGGIRCYKEHGMKFTIKRSLEHLGIPMGIELKRK